MIKALFAQTNEVDEVDIAIIDIMEQLKLDSNLLTNSIGIIFCNIDSLAPSTLNALCKRFPFDVTGFNSPISLSSALTADHSFLTVAVLTSDDVVFSCGLSKSLSNETREPMFELYDRLAGQLNNPPRLAFLFGPTQNIIPANHVLKDLVEAAGECPVFGGAAIDYFTEAQKPFVIYNGQTYEDRASVILFDGDINPKFSFFPIVEKRGLKNRAIINEVEGKVIKQINAMPALDYFDQLGLAVSGRLDIAKPIPLFIADASAMAATPAVIVGQTPEGHIICSFEIEKNSFLGLGIFEESQVLATINELVEELKWEKFDFCWVVSCITRNFALGLNHLAEFDAIRKGLGDMLPFVVAYSGGEACPTSKRNEPLAPSSFNILSLACCRF
ncbi:MAG: hypothetical protein LBT62_02230 [Deltaproteobacteria bacterium]|jgi:hypothetical protein|nr:hypothetical protein [Deltaproteobacteria bacterium]